MLRYECGFVLISLPACILIEELKGRRASTVKQGQLSAADKLVHLEN